MNIRYDLEPDLGVDEFLDVLLRSTLAERRPIEEARPETSPRGVPGGSALASILAHAPVAEAKPTFSDLGPIPPA
jgi:hypothetical protein